MWMQQSMEGGGHHQGGGYGNYGVGGGSNRGAPSNDEDWKSRIVSNGQWLGEKVMQLATRTHNTIPDNQRTMNDGRANWMAEIRSNARPGGNSSSFSGGSYNAGGYQNDFATERPGQYSDTYRPTSTYSDNPTSYSANTSSGPTSTYKKSSKASKSSSNNKKHKSKSSRRAASSSESDDDDDDSEELSEDSDVKKKSTKVRAKVVKKPEVIASSADDDSEVDTKPKKSTKVGKKAASAKKQAAVSSESDASTESAPEDKKPAKKTAAKASKKAYSYALDASKLAAVAAPSEAGTKKAGKKKAGKKADKAAAPLEVVDLLGVESLTISSTPSATAAVFEAPKPLSTIDQLAGLSFDPLDAPQAPLQPPQDQFAAPHQPFVSQPQQVQPQQFLQQPQQFHHQPQQFHQQPPQQFPQQAFQQQQHPAGFVVPGSNLVDLRLSSEVLAAAKANMAPADTRSLDQLKASSGNVQPPPALPRMMAHPGYHQPVHQPNLMGLPQHNLMAQPMLQHPMHVMAPQPMAYGVQYPTQPHPSRRDGVSSPGFL